MIARITEGFGRLGLRVGYEPSATRPLLGRRVPMATLGGYSGLAFLHGGTTQLPSGFGAAGDGATSEHAVANAYAGLVARYVAGLLHAPYLAYLRHHALVPEELLARIEHRGYLPGFVSGPEDPGPDAVGAGDLLRGTGVSRPDVAQRAAARGWVDAWSLNEGRRVKLPFSWWLSLAGAAGLASAGTLAEAITRAACDVFARAATERILAARREVPTIARRSIADSELQARLKLFADHGIAVTVKDFSLDGRFPCVGVVFRNDRLRALRGPAGAAVRARYGRVLTAAADFDRRQALRACFTAVTRGRTPAEFLSRAAAVAAWRVWLGALGRSDRSRSEEPRFLETGAEVSFDSLPHAVGRDARDDVRAATAICEREHTRLLVIDTTHPALRFPSVAVVVPRLLSRSLRPSSQGGRAAAATALDRLAAGDDWLAGASGLGRLIRRVEALLATDVEARWFRPQLRLEPLDLYRLLAYAHLARGAVPHADGCLALAAGAGDPDAAALRARLPRAPAGRRDRARLRAVLEAIDPAKRWFVTEPPVNPLRSLTDEPGLRPEERGMQRHVADEVRQFLASWATPAG
jgi:ribosomal protein S12 methylthiotransferase accessory factor YcaO